jgi:UDP:flavonoid glycosyltransferase YjiC (YdhE family)
MQVLITTQPAFSHATQLIPLARELERRGHAVTFATSAALATTLGHFGIATRIFRPDGLRRHGHQGLARAVGPHGVPDRSAVEDLVELARDTRAELIVRDYYEFAAWGAAQVLEIPLVTQGVTSRLPAPAEARMVDLVAQMATLAGLEPPHDGEALIGSLHLDVIPPSFRHPWEPESDRRRASRPSLFDGSERQPPPPWLDALGRDRPLIYVTLGGVSNNAPVLWRALLAVVSQLEADAVLTTGTSRSVRLGTLPPNVRIESYIPQGHVLARSAAVLCHAGLNTLMGAFNHGVPALCLPLEADQPVNAICCDRAGAGINAANGAARDERGPVTDPATLDPDEIAAGITRLLEESAFARAAAGLGKEIQSMPGPSEIAGILEMLVETGRPGL